MKKQFKKQSGHLGKSRPGECKSNITAHFTSHSVLKACYNFRADLRNTFWLNGLEVVQENCFVPFFPDQFFIRLEEREELLWLFPSMSVLFKGSVAAFQSFYFD